MHVIQQQSMVVHLDCSTVDVDSARAVAEGARAAGMAMVDAPVSGGVGGATAGTLTFMVGGPDEAFEAARQMRIGRRTDPHGRSAGFICGFQGTIERTFVPRAALHCSEVPVTNWP